MENRQFQVTFNINGQLNSNLQAALNRAEGSLRNLERRTLSGSQRINAAMSRLSRQQSQNFQIQAMQQLNRAMNETRPQLLRARLDAARLRQEYENQARSVETMKATLQRLREVRAEQTDRTRYRIMGEQIRAATAELRQHERALSESYQNYTRQNSQSTRLSNSLETQTSQLNRLQSSLRAAGVSAQQMAQSETQLQNSINQTNAAMERQARHAETRNAHAEAGANFHNAADNFQSSLSTAQNIMNPFKSAIDNAKDFEFEMSKVKALTQMRDIRGGNMDQVNASMAELTAEAKRLGRTTEYTKIQAAQMQGYYGMAGMNAKKIKAVGRGTMDLATATNTDLGRMADIVSDLMTAVNYKAGESVKVAGKDYEAASHFMDVFGYTTTQANTNSEALFDTMKYCAPIASEFGLSLHELAAASMVTADSGVKASQAGTSMRMGLLRIVGPTKKTAATIDELGINLSDATAMAMETQAALQGLGINTNFAEGVTDAQKFTSITDQFYTKLQGMSDNERLSTISTVFGVESSTYWAKFFKDYAKYKEKLAEMDAGIEGWTEDTAKVMRDNTKTREEILKSAWDSAMGDAGDALKPAYDGALQGLTSMAEKLDEVIQKNPQAVQGAAMLAAAFAAAGVGLAGFGMASAGLTYLSTSFQLLQSTATMAASRVTAFWAAATAGSSSSAAVNAIRNLGSAFMGAARGAMAFVFSPVGAVLMAIALAGLYCYQNWSTVGPIFSQLGGIISGALGGAIQTLTPALNQVWTAVQRLAPAFAAVGGVIFGVFATALNVVLRLGATIVTAFATAFSGLISFFGGLGNALASALAGNWGQAAEQFKQAFVDAGNAIVDTIKGLFSGIGDTFTHFLDPVKSMLGMSVEGGNATSGGGSFGSPAQAAPVDTSQAQAQINGLGTSAEQAAQATTQISQSAEQNAQSSDTMSQIFTQMSASMTGIETSMTGFDASAMQAQTSLQGISQTGTEITTNFQTAGTEIQTVGTNAQAAATELTNLQSQSAAASPMIQQLGTAAQGAVAGVTSLGTAAGSSASSLSQIASAAGSVASALSSKAAEISSIHISAPSVSTASNAKGGIYPKGAFLTTFAEKSPEAAIPLDKSKRAVKLWEAAGRELGQLPGNNGFATRTPSNQKIPTLEKARQKRAEQVLRQAKLENLKTPDYAPTPVIKPTYIPKPQDIPQPTKPTIKPEYIPKPQDIPQPKVPPQTPPAQVDSASRLSKLSERVQKSKSGQALKNRLEQKNRTSSSLFKNPVRDFEGNKNIGSISPVAPKFGGNILGGDISQIFKGGIQLPGLPSVGSLGKMPDYSNVKGTVLNHNGGGKLGDIETPAEKGSAASFQPTINLTITVNGNANGTEIEQAGTKLSTDLTRQLEDWWRNKNREERRRSYS